MLVHIIVLAPTQTIFARAKNTNRSNARSTFETCRLRRAMSVLRDRTGRFSQAEFIRLLCRFSDAGMTRLSTLCGGRRPKGAKARNRGKWGTGGAWALMEI